MVRDLGDFEVMRETAYDYLVELRDSGETNMWGAASYLHRDFPIDRHTARDVLLDWIESF